MLKCHNFLNKPKDTVLCLRIEKCINSKDNGQSDVRYTIENYNISASKWQENWLCYDVSKYELWSITGIDRIVCDDDYLRYTETVSFCTSITATSGERKVKLKMLLTRLLLGEEKFLKTPEGRFFSKEMSKVVKENAVLNRIKSTATTAGVVQLIEWLLSALERPWRSRVLQTFLFKERRQSWVNDVIVKHQRPTWPKVW